MWLLPTVRQVTRFAWYLCLLFAEITNACINYRNPVNHPGELNRTITKNGVCGLWGLNVGESYTFLPNGRDGHDCMWSCSTWISFRLWSCTMRSLVEPSISYYRSHVSANRWPKLTNVAGCVEMGKDLCPNLCRKLISVFHNPHWKGRHPRPTMPLTLEYLVGVPASTASGGIEKTKSSDLHPIGPWMSLTWLLCQPQVVAAVRNEGPAAALFLRMEVRKACC